MKKKFATLLLAGMLPFTACVNDLNVVPLDDDEVTTASFYQTKDQYFQVLAKLYGGLALSGQQGPAGAPDIVGLDEGSQASYLRMYWSHQELPTDEAVIAWNDQTIKDFHDQDWGSNDPFILGMYSRLFFQIAVANELIRAVDNGSLSSADMAEIKKYKAEARFLRALSYWHALDLFDGNVPFVTEADKPGAFLPPQTNKNDLYAYIESELLDIVAGSDLAAPMQNTLGRADKGAAWMLLSKLYLNAEVYTGTAQYAKAAEYAEKVNTAGYTLESNYEQLFSIDNTNSKEIVFRIVYEGQTAQTWGGMTFLVHAALAGDMNPVDRFGVDFGWGGIRSTAALVDKFPAGDKRALFYTTNRTKEIENIGVFEEGYSVVKYTNTSVDRTRKGSHPTFPDTDFPLFRLADSYLIYAECAARGAGDKAKAAGYVNQLRTRAGAAAITATDLTPAFVLDERSRELYWECHRRTDLRRYGLLTTGTYLWPWKGGVKEGRATDAKYNIFPLPASDVTANPNLTQNAGY